MAAMCDKRCHQTMTTGNLSLLQLQFCAGVMPLHKLDRQCHLVITLLLQLPCGIALPIIPAPNRATFPRMCSLQGNSAGKWYLSDWPSAGTVQHMGLKGSGQPCPASKYLTDWPWVGSD